MLNRTFLVMLILALLSFASHAEEVFTYNSHGKRDPFMPLVGGKALKTVIETLEDVMSIEDITLQGIASDSSGRKAAILNGEMVKEGQTVGHITMKKILKKEIILTIDGDEYKLNIYGEELQ